MLRILVTGGSGFIGSHFIDLCLAKNLQVLNLDNLSLANNLKLHTKNSKNLVFSKVNIQNLSLLRKNIKNFKPHYIFNFAAETHVDKSISNPDQFIKTNYLGVFNILESIKEIDNKIIFIQISTDEVFGSLDLTSKKSFNFKSKYNPSNPYSASKAAANLLIRSYKNTYNLKTYITYCSNNFGERQYLEKFIPLTIFNFLNKTKMSIYGNGKNIREWIYVKNHCLGLFKLIYFIENNKNNKIPDIFFFGSSNRLTNLSFCKKIYYNIYKDTKFFSRNIKFVKDRAGHDLKYAIDYKSTQSLLGKFNETNFNNALDNTVNFYSKNFQKYKHLYLNDKWFIKYRE